MPHDDPRPARRGALLPAAAVAAAPAIAQPVSGAFAAGGGSASFGDFDAERRL
jgi:hypothetical protein